MKKFLIVLLALLGCMGICAAEELSADQTYTFDLDGDGVAEELMWYQQWGYNGAPVNAVKMSVNGAELWESENLDPAHVFVRDIDGDGKKEVFVTGDAYVDNYITYCFNYEDGSLNPLMFAGQNDDGAYYKHGHGVIEFMDDGSVKLVGEQHIMGVQLASRIYRLELGVFELADDGIWRFENKYDDPLSYPAIAPKLGMEIEVTFITTNGEVSGSIQTGEKLLITASDMESVVWFGMEDGREGWFGVEYDPEMECWLIGGVPEADIFSYLPGEAEYYFE